MNKTRQDNDKKTGGFTLLEIMIAVSIFGLLMLFASQYMRVEIRGYDAAAKQNELEQKARIAMMQILDEIRLNNLTFYKSTSASQGIYRYADAAKALEEDETDASCLIYLNLQAAEVTPPSTTEVFFDKSDGKLWYLSNGSQHLIADDITQLSISQESSLVKIDLIVGGSNGTQPFELLTWARLT